MEGGRAQEGGREGGITAQYPLRPSSHSGEEGGEDYRPIPCSLATKHLLSLLSSLRTYVHPSNAGPWSDELGFFLSHLTTALAKRVGWQAADADFFSEAEGEGGREGEEVRMPVLKEEDVTAVVEGILPLAHQCLYNKNPSVISAGETILKTLAYLRPSLVAKYTLPLLTQALDPSSLTTTHQAPASLKALAVLTQPLLLAPHPFLLSFLPTLLPWSLPGLDSNDIQKTAATVGFYIALLDWLPLLPALPPSLPPRDPMAFSQRLLLLPRKEGEEGREDEGVWDEAVAEVASVLGEWALMVVDKCLGMMMDKEGGAGSGSAEGGGGGGGKWGGGGG